MKINLPYGRGAMPSELPDDRIAAVMESKLHDYEPGMDGAELVEQAMRSPIGSPSLCELARGKRSVVIIASDHTRPVPSKLIIPAMLREIRRGSPDACVTLLIATGCHRETTKDELVAKFGADIVENERIVIHDCDDESNLVTLGTLPSGGTLRINRIAAEADLLTAEGFIEPHFFAGFSGGRKSVLPGVAAREAVLYNHCAELIAHPKARTGALSGNPIHEDMLWAAKRANLRFIVNVVLGSGKRVVHAVAGDAEAAHAAGCAFLSGQCRVRPVEAGIVVTTNGGYPLDQNIYQAVKGMTAAEATVQKGGAIIMLAKSEDGHGGEKFRRQLADEPDGRKTLAQFMARGRGETEPDQWQTQIFLRVLERAHVFYLSDAPDELVRSLHMTPIHSVEEGVRLASQLPGLEHARIAVIPDGVSVMVTEE